MTIPIPDGSVIITPRQMYDEIQATRGAVEKLTNTVDPALTEVRADIAKHTVEIDALFAARNAHGNRLTAIETKLAAAWAVIGLLVAACGVLVALLGRG